MTRLYKRDVLELGLLSHSTMKKGNFMGKMYGDIDLVTGRGHYTGTWHGQAMEADEWLSSVRQWALVVRGKHPL